MNAGDKGVEARASKADAIFVSDVHLSAFHPATVDAFLGFLAREVAGRSERLFILGDLFEYWAGDDDLDAPFNRRIVDALRALADDGIELAFMAGNRDFLIGDEFAKAAGIALLPDPYRLELSGLSFMLSHGDALCTDDIDYQRFRAMVREPSWQQAFLARPLAERRAIIGDMRMKSEAAKRDKAADIMDVNADAVARLFKDHGQTRLIHGHTHRPAHHVLEVGNERCERWVLPDWDAEAQPPRGGALVLDHGELRVLDMMGVVHPRQPTSPMA